MWTRRLIRIAAASAVAVVAAAAIAWWLPGNGPTAAENGLRLARDVQMGGPFELVDHTGRAVTDADFRGEYLLMYFGFTFCPDVCPTELAEMTQAVDLLGDDAARVRPVFVTIDPERDTPEAVGQYVALFHPRMVGLTGSPQQIAQAAANYRVFYRRVDDPDHSYYLMDHSSFIYLVGPDGALQEVFTQRDTPEDIAAAIRQRLETGGTAS